MFRTGDIIKRKDGSPFADGGLTAGILAMSWANTKLSSEETHSLEWLCTNCVKVEGGSVEFKPFWMVVAADAPVSAYGMVKYLSSEEAAIEVAQGFTEKTGKEFVILKTTKLVKPVQAPVEVVNFD